MHIETEWMITRDLFQADAADLHDIFGDGKCMVDRELKRIAGTVLQKWYDDKCLPDSIKVLRRSDSSSFLCRAK